MGFPLSNELDGWDEGSLKGLSFCLFSGCLDALGQPEKHGAGADFETFAPQQQPETQEMPSFPRRRESCLIFKKFRKNNLLHKINQESRLRGNDGELTISCFVLGFAKAA